MAKVKHIGIYKIENKINGKVYIGQSIDIYARWVVHKRDLNKETHHNRHLQNSWNLYTRDSFSFEIIEECNDKALNEREISLIEEYSNKVGVYNLTIGGDGGSSPLSNELKEGRRRLYYESGRSKPIVQFDMNNNYIKTWVGAKEVYKKTGYIQNCIRDCCTGNRGRTIAYGFYWAYEKDYLELGIKGVISKRASNKENYLKSEKHINRKPRKRKPRKKQQSEYKYRKKVVQLNDEYEIIKVWESVTEINETNNMYLKNSLYSAMNCIKRYHGFYWAYEKSYDQVMSDMNR